MVPRVGRDHLDAVSVVTDVAHGRVELDVQPLGQRHGHARVAVAHCKQTRDNAGVRTQCTANSAIAATPRRTHAPDNGRSSAKRRRHGEQNAERGHAARSTGPVASDASDTSDLRQAGLPRRGGGGEVVRRPVRVGCSSASTATPQQPFSERLGRLGPYPAPRPTTPSLCTTRASRRRSAAAPRS